MIFIDKGFVYRRGVWIKELGERMGRIPLIRVFSGAVISLGLAVIDRAVSYGAGERTEGRAWRTWDRRAGKLPPEMEALLAGQINAEYEKILEKMKETRT